MVDSNLLAAKAWDAVSYYLVMTTFRSQLGHLMFSHNCNYVMCQEVSEFQALSAFSRTVQTVPDALLLTIWLFRVHCTP